MTRAAVVQVACAGALAFLSGLLSQPARWGLVQAIAASLPVPAQRYLLTQYAAWVFTVVGFGYVSYLATRSTRTGALAQELLRFGRARRLILRAARGFFARLAVLVATVLVAGSAGALLRGAPSTSAVLVEVLQGFGVWLLELVAVGAILATVGWTRPRGPAGILASMLLIPIGAITAAPLVQIGILAVLTAALIAALFLTTLNKDWTTQ